LKLAEARRQPNEEAARLLESITDAFVALDPGGRITYANAAAEKLAGAKREQMLGRDYWEIFPEAIGTALDHELSRAMRDRVPADFEYHYAASDAWYQVKAQPASDGGISIFSRDITKRKRAESEREMLAQRARLAHDEAEALNEVARALGSEFDLQKLVQIVTDIATRLTRAEFGAFFYNVLNDEGESYMLYTLSGAPREAFEKFGMMPRNTPIFHTTFSGLGPRRSDDIRKDPDYGKMPPHFGMPKGHLPVCSYLAVPGEIPLG
jgi:PAS domain S-box-containing protein